MTCWSSSVSLLMAPQNLSVFFPWFLAILVAVALFLFVFGIIKDFTHTFARGGRF